MSPRVTALAPSLAAATSEFPDDGDADANRIVVAVFVVAVTVAVAAALAAAAFLAIGGSSVAHAAVDDDVEAADVEAIAPARMREAAWRSIVGGEDVRQVGVWLKKLKLEKRQRKNKEREKRKKSASHFLFSPDLFSPPPPPRPPPRGKREAPRTTACDNVKSESIGNRRFVVIY